MWKKLLAVVVGVAAGAWGQEQVPREGPNEWWRGVLVRGQVLMEDGAPLPERAEVSCDNGRFRTYTDSKGYFSFMLGEGGVAPGDVMAEGHATRRCVSLMATIPGYQSKRVGIPPRLGPDQIAVPIDLNGIVLRPLRKAESGVVSAADLKAPKEAREAREARERGLKALREGDSAKAAAELRKATKDYPEFTTAWLELAGVETRARHWDGALAAADAAARLDAARPEAHQYRALALWGSGKVEGARASAREAVKLDGEHRFARAACLLGTLELESGESARAVEAFRKCKEFAKDPRDLAVAREQLERLGVRE